MWDACMDHASIGIGLMSQLGITNIIKQEYLAAGDAILDTFEADTILGGVGNTSRNLMVNAIYQWVSVGAMLAPSPDRFVGVADIRMCDGDQWRESMKVCLELFSTATATDKIVAEMERNSLQANNCSFGYVLIRVSQNYKHACYLFAPTQLFTRTKTHKRGRPGTEATRYYFLYRYLLQS